MNRKNFIKNVGYTFVGGTAAVVMLQSCASASYFAPHVLSNNQLSIKKTEFVNVENNNSDVYFINYLCGNLCFKNGTMSRFETWFFLN